MKQKIIPIISVVVGLLAFILTYQYLRGKLAEVQKEWDRLHAGTKTIAVMVPVKDIPRGTTIQATDIEPKDIPVGSASDQFVALEDGRDLLNKKALRSLKQGSPI